MPIKEDVENMSASRRKHPVPQNVMDVEFKVVGDLTVRQIMYLFAGALLVFIFYKSGLPVFWRWVFMIFTGTLSIAVAFVPIQERGLDKWIVSFVNSLKNPSQRIWRKSYSPPDYFLADYAQIIKNEIITLTPAKSRSKLDEYLGQMSTGQADYDSDELAHLSQIQNLYSQVTTETITKVKETTPSLKDITKSEMDSKEEFLGAKPIDRAMVNMPNELKGEIDVQTTTKMPSTIAMQDIKDIEKREKQLQKKIKELLATTKKAKKQFSKTQTSKEHKKNRLAFFHSKYSELEQEREKLSSQIKEKQEGTKSLKQENIDKNFAHQIDSLQKENEHLEEQLAVIQKEIDSLLQEKSIPQQAVQQPTRVVNQTTQAAQQAAPTQPTRSVNQPTQSVQQQPPKEKRKLSMPHVKMPHVNMPSLSIPEISMHSKKNKRQVQRPPQQPVQKQPPKEPTVDLRKTAEQTAANLSKATQAIPQIITSEEAPVTYKEKKAKPAKVPESVTNKTNIIHGIAKDANGELIENAVVIIKNADGDVVRALKTNKLGQFKTQTALPNNKYTVEIVKGKSKFDIISVDVHDNVLSPIYLIAKA